MGRSASMITWAGNDSHYRREDGRLQEFLRAAQRVPQARRPEDPANRAKVDELLRSLITTSGDEQIIFDEYVGRREHRVTKKDLVKECGEMSADAEEKYDYRKFDEQPNKFLKLGFHEDAANRLEVSELLRLLTSEPGDGQTSFKEHVGRIKEGKHDIRYINGESIAAVSSSPCSEGLCKKGHGVMEIVAPR